MKNVFVAVLPLFLLISCHRNNIREQQQWAEIFTRNGADSGCFELADNSHEQVFYYNLDRASRRYSPASTFKIVNSLIALETDVAPDENMVIAWDGIVRPRAEWNKDMNMREAFAISCLPYYQEIARRIGAIEMQKWVDTLNYGNRRIGGKIDEFWLNDTMMISADEQVGFMKKLYFDKLPFAQRTQRIVRNLMLREDSLAYRLYYKTGTSVHGNHIVGWLVGFIERKEVQKGVLTHTEETNYKPYFFAMNCETADTTKDVMAMRLNILKDVLRERQILK
jgi:beta-lactamase class D